MKNESGSRAGDPSRLGLTILDKRFHANGSVDSNAGDALHVALRLRVLSHALHLASLRGDTGRGFGAGAAGG